MQQSPIVSPTIRNSMAVAYLPSTHMVIAYGGRTSIQTVTESNETWSWDGSKWLQIGVPGPSVHSPLMAYDGKAALVLYGFVPEGNHEVGQTWTFDGTHWSQQQVTSPPARSSAAMAWDPASNRVIVFGGTVLSERRQVNETWAWDGVGWSLLQPAHSPTARQRSAMGPVSKTNTLLLVGGGSNVVFSDAWVWNGSDWGQVAGFGPRIDGSVADTDSGLIYFGGSGLSGETNDTWLWDGTTWQST